MDFAALYSFLFDSYAGVGIMIAAGLLISIVACVIMERKTRKTFVDRGPDEDDDDWSFFDEDSEGEKD